MSFRLRLDTVDEGLIDSYAELSRTEYSDIGVCRPEHLRWKNLANPAGVSLAYNLFDGDRLVGRIVYQKRRFHRDGQILDGAYLVDLLIHPEVRGIQTFVMLMRKFREVDDLAFLYLTPNATSIPLYRNVLGLKDLLRLEAYATPLRFGRLMESLLGRRIAWIDRIASAAWQRATRALGGALALPSSLTFDDLCPGEGSYRALIERVERDGLFRGDRGFAFHRWRFHDSPHDRYQVVYAYQGENLAGYVATRIATHEGLSCLFLIDAVFDRRLTAADHVRTLLYCFGDARRMGCDILMTLLNPRPDVAKALRRFPMFRVPSRLLPQEMPLFFVDLSSEGISAPDPHRFPVTLADLDVF